MIIKRYALSSLLIYCVLHFFSGKPGFATTTCEHVLTDSSLVNIALQTDSIPSDFPKLVVISKDSPSPGKIYLANYKYSGPQGGTYMMILDSEGNVLFHRNTGPGFVMDFKPNPNRLYTYYDENVLKFYAMDSTFTVIDSFEAAGGYSTDGHELRFLPNGGYVLLAIDSEKHVDMRKFAPYGDSDATVLSDIIQEFDAQKNLVFQWHTRDYFSISDAYGVYPGSSVIDFVHSNSVEMDGDTAYILSSKNLEEVTKIDRRNGNIIWRWGGAHNQFSFVNDSFMFSYQHAVRRLPNGNVIMFDNGFSHKSPILFSRAIEYKLDEVNKIATKVWEFRHAPDIYSESMGYAQRLENGNTFIGWGDGDGTAVTEVRPDGSIALELGMKGGNISYRAYKSIGYGSSNQTTSNVMSTSRAEFPSLGQNFPNPVTGITTIPFSLHERTHLKLTVYDILGRAVQTLFDGIADAQECRVSFDGGNVPCGTYFYMMATPSSILSRSFEVVR
jgi:hypothetical protein